LRPRPVPWREGSTPSKPRVAAVVADFDIDAGREAGGVSRDQEFAFCHVGTNAFGVDAVAFDERPLDAESGVNQAYECVDIGKIRNAKRHRGKWRERFCGLAHRFISIVTRISGANTGGRMDSRVRIL
jgi:hypothetical protein